MSFQNQLKKDLIAEIVQLREKLHSYQTLEATLLKTEERLRKVNRTLKTLQICNDLVIHEKEEARLFHEICKIIVYIGGYRMAFIGFAEHNEQKSIKIITHSGFEEGYLHFLRNLSWGDNEYGRGPGGRAIRTGRPAIFNDILNNPDFAPWRAEAVKRGYASTLSLPLILNNQTIGVLAIYSTEPNAFDHEETELLTKLAENTSYGILSIRERNERAQTEEKFQQLAFYDPLTGLPNRISFQKLLENAILEGHQKGKAVAVLLLDLDRFKEINDTLGHHRGDFLLQKVGSRLKNLLRPTDTVARLGGDEFGVILLMSSSNDAILVSQKIIKTLVEPFEVEGLPIAVETSIGVALYPDHGKHPATLLQKADVAMYASKRNKLEYVLYSIEMDQHSPRRLAMMGELRQALEKEDLFLLYQPKIELKTGQMIGVEALIRWNHPTLGNIPPDQFILPAEQSGLIKPLTFLVLRKALNQVAAWRKRGINLTMGVNLSTRNLQDPRLPSQITELLQTCGADPAWLNLEITESAIMSNTEHAVETMNFLNKRGINFSIDDFGVGYSSLNYLKRLPVESVKIDKSFVIDMMTNEEDAMIVRSTIQLAKTLNLKVVAEGVENQESLQALKTFGCDEAQGYFISKPVPPEEIARLLEKRLKFC